jgi:phosphatidylserine decarboxylase
MRSTIGADLFYKLNINPFYVVALLTFLVPISSFVFFNVIIGISPLFSLIYTILVFLVCSLVFYLYFHRNPKRETIYDDHAILSPADGTIVYIKEITRGMIVESVKNMNHMRLTELLNFDDTETLGTSSSLATGYIIGIELRLFDVHITRAPISGMKLLDHHVSGRIVSMNNPGFEYINDRETVVIKQEKNDRDQSFGLLQIAVVQIATFITRTVKSYVKDKTRLKQGEPLGMIRLGSQVDLVIYSKDVDILVNEHDRVYAGLTKIAEIKV